MAHTHTALHYHCVFSTLGRRRLLYPELLDRTCRYITGITKNIRGRMLRVNGTDDHLHVLLGLPPDVDVAEAMMKIKANSSKWIHETLPNMRQFAWQEGYQPVEEDNKRGAGILPASSGCFRGRDARGTRGRDVRATSSTGCYGAFVVEPCNLGRVIEYIIGQGTHHTRQTFEEEFVALLKQHGIDFDPETVFG